MTAAMCLQQSAQSGQEQFAFSSDHFCGKRCRCFFLNSSYSSAGSFLCESCERMKGCLAISERMASFCSFFNGGMWIFTLYGLGRDPCTAAHISPFAMVILLTEPLRAYRMPRGRRLE